jgi:tetratricopeptide (TPR) repeat protein
VDHYNRGDYFDSLTHLHKAVNSFRVKKLDYQLKRENETVFKIIKECYLFSASCYIKINQFDSAVGMMNELLETEPRNFKALFLRGSALFHLNEIPMAYQDFLHAGSIDPGNTSIVRYIQDIEEAYPELGGEPQQSGMCQNGMNASFKAL